MPSLTVTLDPTRRETLRETLLLSLVFHALLAVSVFAYVALGLRLGGTGGTNWAAGGAVRVSAVSSLPGIPLPTPELATQNTLATGNPGLYHSEPPKLELPAQAVKIPKFEHAAPVHKPVRVNKRIQAQAMQPPDNAVPFGQGGQPSMNYNQFVTSAGQGGFKFGEGNFGQEYGWYVDAVRNRVSGNWLVSTISPNILTAPRVYVDFDILRDGTVANVEIKQSSSIPEVDRSALRAVLASNPLAPLPPGYSGNQVSVEFYFDFSRR
jgi:periplasmic protein TonB